MRINFCKTRLYLGLHPFYGEDFSFFKIEKPFPESYLAYYLIKEIVNHLLKQK